MFMFHPPTGISVAPWQLYEDWHSQLSKISTLKSATKFSSVSTYKLYVWELKLSDQLR